MKQHDEPVKNISPYDENALDIPKLLEELRDILSSASLSSSYENIHQPSLNFHEIVARFLAIADVLLSRLEAFVSQKPKSEAKSKSKGKKPIKSEKENGFEPELVVDQAKLADYIITAKGLLVEEQSLLANLPKHLLALYTWLSLRLPQLKSILDSNSNEKKGLIKEVLENLSIVKKIILTDLFGLSTVPHSATPNEEGVIENQNTSEKGFFITTYPPREDLLHQANAETTPSRFTTLIEGLKRIQKQADADAAIRIQQIIISLGFIEAPQNACKIDYIRTRISQLEEFIDKELDVLKAKPSVLISLLDVLRVKPSLVLVSLLKECKKGINQFAQDLEVTLHNQNILPAEIIEHIGKFSDYKTQIQLSGTCRFFNLNIKSVLDKSNSVNFVRAAVGSSHTVLIKGDGTVWGCGNNERGQLGLGDQQRVRQLQKIPGLPKIKQVAAAMNRTLFLGEDGKVWSCGDNYSGKLGFKDYGLIHTPIQVPGLPKIKRIVTGYKCTIFIAEDGSVWCCGDNSDGQLGLSHRNKQFTPVKIPGLAHIKVKQAAIGWSHMLFLDENGEVWGYGDNTSGQLGLDSQIKKKNTLIKISGLSNIKQIAAGHCHSLFSANDGKVWGCGSNSRGQLGLGSKDTDKNHPITELAISNTVQIIAVRDSSLFVKVEGTAWACGSNHHSCLGLQSTDHQFTLIQIPGLANIKHVVSQGDSVESHSLFLSGEVVYGCGNNFYNQLVIDNEKEIKELIRLFQSSLQKIEEPMQPTMPNGPK